MTTPTHEEAIARIVDPGAWSDFDYYMENAVGPNHLAVDRWRVLDSFAGCRKSLSTARQIIATEWWKGLSCDEQFALASKIAGNVGYELVAEPEHPDSPHRSQQEGEGEPVESAAEYNARFDPADEAGREAFDAGWKCGWMFATCPDEWDEEAYRQVDDGVAQGEAWEAHRSQFFARLPLAAVDLPTPPEPSPKTEGGESHG